MNDMSQLTRKFVRPLVDYPSTGVCEGLTSGEIAQLATAWLRMDALMSAKKLGRSGENPLFASDSDFWAKFQGDWGQCTIYGSTIWELADRCVLHLKEKDTQP